MVGWRMYSLSLDRTSLPSRTLSQATINTLANTYVVLPSERRIDADRAMEAPHALGSGALQLQPQACISLARPMPIQYNLTLEPTRHLHDAPRYRAGEPHGLPHIVLGSYSFDTARRETT